MRVILVALLLFSSAAFAGEIPARHIMAFNQFDQGGISPPDYTDTLSYNVLNYKLYMDWYDALSGQSQGFNGKMEITFVPSLIVPLDSIQLNCNSAYLHVDSAVSNGSRLKTANSGVKLTVFLEQPLNSGDTGLVVLYYRETDPGVSPAPDSLQKGFYLYYRGATTTAINPAYVPATVAYTMSEPSDARDWMPCHDVPTDKALSEISVRVPNGFVAASNGVLASKIDNGDGSTTFNWKEDHPIATYLMCATASHFALIQRNYITTNGDTIPVQYYVYPQDSLRAVNGAGCNIDTVISIMKFYSSIYEPYPFEKYGMTGIEPFQYGGMEHQTITTMNRSYEFDRRDVAHELAHQWWGDMVTLGTWKDIWLNEGFATYSEAMQLQHLSETQFENEMLFYASQFFIEDSTVKRYAVYDPPTGYIFGLAEYYKGAWVLHMLRSIVEDSTFFAIMRQYRADYEYGNAVTSDFENVVNTVTQSKMDWFFNEWIYDAGYPVYTKTFSQSADSLFVTINQIQQTPPVYRMPIDIGIYSGGNLTVHSVTDSEVTQTFNMPFKGSVDSLVLDPYHKILARFPGQSLTEVGESGASPQSYTLLQNYPNPFNSITQVIYHLAAPGMVSVELYDVLGRKVETLVHGFQSSGLHRVSLNASKLASGVYICRLTTPNRQMTTKLVLEK
ncbi:MAG: T9SS type A sorting domain-containing protein [Bacteroidetes bacterium]|nr:T9SS type A sorting domain-containing protein [Bacteroidota bacterium]